MKQLIISLIIVITIITGCRYKEGPLISFRSVEKRLNGDWQVIGFTSDGIDSLQNYNDSCGSKMTISLYYPDGSPSSENKINFYDCKIQSMSMGGNFTFSDNKKIMNVNFGDTLRYKSLGPLGGGKSNWKIIILTKKDFKISTDFNGRNYKISFKK